MEVRRELETHLRDTVGELRQRGLNEEESFWLARRRVGQPRQLGEEFIKVDPNSVWGERVFWMTLAVLLVWLWNGSAVIIGLVVSNFILNFANGATESGLSWLPLSLSGIAHFVRILIRILPICGFALFLAKGRLNTNWAILSFFRSRSRLAIVTGIWSLMITGFTIWSNWESSQHIHLRQMAADAPKIIVSYSIWENLFYSLSFPLVLVALLVWLMPSRLQAKPKLA
jgi:hypothetical protein